MPWVRSRRSAEAKAKESRLRNAASFAAHSKFASSQNEDDTRPHMATCSAYWRLDARSVGGVLRALPFNNL